MEPEKLGGALAKIVDELGVVLFYRHEWTGTATSASRKTRRDTE